jgi:hypothetical protein
MKLDMLEGLLSPAMSRRFDRGDSGIDIAIDIHTDIYEREQRRYRARNREIPKRFKLISDADPSDHPAKTLVQELRRKLAAYYVRRRAHPFIIEIPDDTYQPRITDKCGREYELRTPARKTRRPDEPSLTRGEDPQLHGGETARAFREFFGEGISADQCAGVIIVQSDRMDELLKDESSRHEITERRSRLYKARTWACAWDIFGATVIQQEFQKHGLMAPRLFLTDHHVRDGRHHYASFKISMGLGFTDETIRAIESKACGPWMHISKTFGDALSLHKSLLTEQPISRLQTADDEQRPDFRLLFPADWDSNYVHLWFRMQPPINGPEVRDYAIILRHTRLNPQRQVLFVVAGFTERSTAVAARYLVDNWATLWKNHVRGFADTGTRGDFLIIIEGPSDPQLLREWSEVEGFRVTPDKLKSKGISCEWASRIP